MNEANGKIEKALNKEEGILVYNLSLAILIINYAKALFILYF